MTGFREYSYVLGRNIRSVEEIAAFSEENDTGRMNEVGLRQIPTENERLLQDMIQEACQKISRRPDYVMIAHSLPFIRPSGREILFCGHEVPVYYMSGLPCAIMHKAVEAASLLVKAGRYRSVLVVGADKAYSDMERVFFGTIMGDGVVAVLVEEKTDAHRILSSYISTTLFATDGENSEKEDIKRFRQVNASLMRNAMKQCMDRAGLTQVDYYVTHTSNKEFWDGIAALTNIPRDRFLDFNICNTGHMNSHDSFYHYFYCCEEGRIQPGQTAMLINPGFGGTQGCTLVLR